MIIDDLLKHFKDGLKAIDYGDGMYLISYPMFYNNGNPITVAIKVEDEDSLILNDLGATIENIDNKVYTDEFIAEMEEICERYDVQIRDDIIHKTFTKQDFSFALNSFFHAIIIVDALTSKMTDEHNVSKKIQKYLSENK